MAAEGAAVPEDHRVLRAGQAVGGRHPALQGAVARLREEGLRLREAVRHPQEGGQPLREGHLVLGGGPQAGPGVLQGRLLRKIFPSVPSGESSGTRAFIKLS